MASHYRVLAAVVLVALCTSSAFAKPGFAGIWPPASATNALYRDVPGARDVIKRALDLPVLTARRGTHSFNDVITYTCNRIFSGSKCMVVGGFVRDAFQNIESKDVDVGVGEGEWSTDRAVRHLQHHFNVGSDLVSNSGIICKVGEPLDGQASYVTPLELVDGSLSIGATNYDRDFTVNSVYYDVGTETFYDPTRKGVEDTLTRTLRVACYGEVQCQSKWWTGLGSSMYRKMQRYFHMRMKGYQAEPTTLSMVMDTLNRFRNEDAMEDFIYGLDKQTLNSDLPTSTFQYKLSLFLEVLAEDYQRHTGSKFSSRQKEEFWRMTIAPLFVEMAQRDKILYVRARGGVMRENLYVGVGRGSDIKLPPNNLVKIEKKGGWYKIYCSDCADQVAMSSTDLDEAIRLTQSYEYGYLKEVGNLSPPVGKSTTNCKRMVDLSLYEVSKYDGLTMKHLSAKDKSNMKEFLEFKSNMHYFEHTVLPKIQEYPGVNYIMKKFLVEYVRKLAVGVAPDDLMRSLDSVVGIPGIFDTTSSNAASNILNVIANGNARERSFMIWNLVTRCPSKWYSRYFPDKYNGIDPCDGATALPLPAGWVYVNYHCETKFGCQSPRESFKGSKFYFSYSSDIFPSLSRREREYLLASDRSRIEWNIGANIYSVSSDMLPNPMLGHHAMQGGFRHQTESNGFETLAGASGSGAWILQFAKQYLDFSWKDLCLLRLALASTMPPTKGHSFYEVMMAADPYMEESSDVKINLMDADTYLSLGKRGLLPKTSSGSIQEYSVSTSTTRQFFVVRGEAYGDPYTQGHLNDWLKSTHRLTARGMSSTFRVFGRDFEDTDSAIKYIEGLVDGVVVDSSSRDHRRNLQAIYAAYESTYSKSGVFIYREIMEIASLVRPLFKAAGKSTNTDLELTVWARVADLAIAAHDFAVDSNTNPSSHRPSKAAPVIKAATAFGDYVKISVEEAMVTELKKYCYRKLSDADVTGENNDRACNAYALEKAKAVKLLGQEIHGVNGLVAKLINSVSKEVINSSDRLLSAKCMQCMSVVNVFQNYHYMTRDSIVKTTRDMEIVKEKYCTEFYFKTWKTEILDRADAERTWSGYFLNAPYPIPGYGAFTYHIFSQFKNVKNLCDDMTGKFLAKYSLSDRRQFVEDVTRAPASGPLSYSWTHKPFMICQEMDHCSSTDELLRSIMV